MGGKTAGGQNKTCRTTFLFTMCMYTCNLKKQILWFFFFFKGGKKEHPYWLFIPSISRDNASREVDNASFHI